MFPIPETDIGKIIIWLNYEFSKTTRIIFVHKENKNKNVFNNSSLWDTVFRHFGEYHDACARFQDNVQEKVHACWM